MALPLHHRPLTRALSVGATLVALGALAGCGGDDAKATDSGETTSSSARTADGPACTYTETGDAAKQVDLPPDKAVVTGKIDAAIETSVGTINASLDGTSAPCTVNSFVSLADQGYFDGTTCHRLTTGAGLLVLQCGDPSGSGRGGPGYSFDDELSGEETYGAGTLAMANAGANTNGSQFFIVYGDSDLPPSYTVFGTVDADSIALVQKVADDGTDNSFGEGDGAPNTAVDITKVTVDE